MDCDRRRRVRRVCRRELVARNRPVSSDDGDVMRALIAGIGNIFLGDDGFGVEVARRLDGQSLGDGVDVADFGIRGIHLAYELAGGTYDAAVLVDAMRRGGEPGTLYVVEPSVDADSAADVSADAHALTPDAVLAWISRVGTRPARLLVVGCEPETVEESVGLSPRVNAAVEEAIAIVRCLATELTGAAPCA